MYVDAMLYVVATMSGLCFGNIYPSTNLEYFIDCFIMVAGSSTYANFFADFSIATQVNNRKVIQNENMLHHARKFAAIKNLGEEVLIKIRYFYTTLRLSFDEFSQKHEILKELPVSLQGEVSLLFNSFLIQNVAFFQLAEPAFIVQMSRSFEPYLCISGESVVRVDEIAGRMYFIHTGYVEILASDNRTTIAY